MLASRHDALPDFDPYSDGVREVLSAMPVFDCLSMCLPIKNNDGTDRMNQMVMASIPSYSNGSTVSW